MKDMPLALPLQCERTCVVNTITCCHRTRSLNLEANANADVTCEQGFKSNISIMERAAAGQVLNEDHLAVRERVHETP